MGMDNNASLCRPPAPSERPTVYLVVRSVAYEGDGVEGVYDTYAGADAHAHAAACGLDAACSDVEYHVTAWRCGDHSGRLERRYGPGGTGRTW